MSNFNGFDVRAYLIELANQKLGLALQPADVTFGTPTLIDGSVVDLSHPDRRNTSVRVTRPLSQQQPEVRLVLRYNRLKLDHLFVLKRDDFPASIGTRLVDFLPAINERTRAALQPEDIVDVELGEITEDTIVEMVASEESLYAFGLVAILITV